MPSRVHTRRILKKDLDPIIKMLQENKSDRDIASEMDSTVQLHHFIKKEAKKMLSKGESIAQVAEKFKIDYNVVKNWDRSIVENICIPFDSAANANWSDEDEREMLHPGHEHMRRHTSGTMQSNIREQIRHEMEHEWYDLQRQMITEVRNEVRREVWREMEKERAETTRRVQHLISDEIRTIQLRVASAGGDTTTALESVKDMLTEFLAKLDIE